MKLDKKYDIECKCTILNDINNRLKFYFIIPSDRIYFINYIN